MNYKELIEILRVTAEYGDVCYKCQNCIGAATALETLLAERDAAVEMLHGKCHACKHNTGWHNRGKCINCVHETARFPKKEDRQADNWQWRGPAPDRKPES